MPELTRQDRFDWNLHQGIVQRGMGEAIDVLGSLNIIRDRKLWRAGTNEHGQPFPSWTQYLESMADKMHLSRRNVFYRLAASNNEPPKPLEIEPAEGRPDEPQNPSDEAPACEAPPEPTEPSDPMDDQGALAAVIDGRGEPVTDPRLQPAFSAVGSFDLAKNLLGRLKTALDEIVAGAGGAFLQGELQDAERHRKDVLAILKFARPYATCPYCQGEGCSGCHKLGWTTQPAYENAPEEMRY